MYVQSVWPDWAIFFLSNFLTKVAQIFGDSVGYLKMSLFNQKTVVAALWTTFRRFGQLLITIPGHLGCPVNIY